jgi:hypothetical protein
LVERLLNCNSLLINLLHRLSKSLHWLSKSLHGLHIVLGRLSICLERLSIRLNRLCHGLHLTILNRLDRLNRSLHVDGLLLSVLSELHSGLLHSWHRIGSVCTSTDNAISIKVEA